MTETLVKFASLRAAIKDGALCGPDAVITAALQIDREFLSLSVTMPPEWQYETVFTGDNPELVYEGYYHVYLDTWIAQIWNNLRVCRILLNQIILEQLKASPTPLSPQYNTQYRLSKETSIQMSSEICATVPQHAGYISSLSVQRCDSSSSASKAASLQPQNKHKFQAHSQEPIPVPASSYFLLWPLFMVGLISTSLTSQRNWVINRLRFVGHTSGILQAVTLAEFLERRERIKIWESMRSGVGEKLRNSEIGDTGPEHPIVVGDE
jgi:hypothetical protein